jgi:putative membrane protein
MKRSENQNHLAEERTLLANERTLLAYIRTFFSATILAFILFRFLEDKISYYLGIFFFFIGLVFLFVGVYYYISRRRKLKIQK